VVFVSVRLRAAAMIPWLVAVVASSARTTAVGAQEHYLLSAARSIAVDSTAERVVAYFDERVLVLLNATLLRLREELVESGACLRIAETSGPDAFKVDSVTAPILDENDPPATWRGTHFTCPESFAPIHWHVITPADTGWLSAAGDTAGVVVRSRCQLSDRDRGPFWSQFPFAAMQCGVGIDSITVYRVKAR
jgi:hypothetical protein